jgi:hypothetical protein
MSLLWGSIFKTNIKLCFLRILLFKFNLSNQAMTPKTQSYQSYENRYEHFLKVYKANFKIDKIGF